MAKFRAWGQQRRPARPEKLPERLLVALDENLDHRVHPITRLQLSHLDLFRPATLDLLLTKMMRGNDEQDMADAEFMIRHNRITERQLTEAFAEMKPIGLEELRDAFARAKPVVLELARKAETES